MAVRTNNSDVQQILPSDLSSDVTTTIIDAFIVDANTVVTDILGDDTELSSAQKELIEKWYTCHLLVSTVARQPDKEKAGDANITYQGKTNVVGLDGTLYGQRVKELDTTGKMAQKLGKRRVRVHTITSFD